MLDWKYFRLFDKTRVCGPSDQELKQFYSKLGSRFRTVTPAGYTYFGQFIDHDLSFMDLTDTMDVSTTNIDVECLAQRRRAALDLDSVYGGGLDDSQVRYSKENGKFYIGLTASGQKRDLPRRKDFMPIIADQRNDDNLLVAQFQVLWMNFHNRVVDYYLSQGYRGGKKLFRLARTEVVNVYRELVLHDFGKTILPNSVYENIICQRRGLLSRPDKEFPMLAVEFPAAAFRLHGMIRNTYRLNQSTKGVTVLDLILRTGRGNKSSQGGYFPLTDDFVIDWRFFFPVDASITHGFAMQISPITPILELPQKIAKKMSLDQNQVSITPLSHASIEQISRKAIENEPVNMTVLSTRRGQQLDLPTGQEVKKYLECRFPDVAADVGLADIQSDILQSLCTKNTVIHETPLWLYIMLEARGLNDAHVYSGSTLGVLGGWIVADSLVNAYLSTAVEDDCGWTPEKSVIYKERPDLNAGKSPERRITMADVIRYTYGDK